MKKYFLLLLFLCLLNPLSSFSFSTLKVDTTTHLFKARSYLKNHIGFGIGGNIRLSRIKGVQYNFKEYKSDLNISSMRMRPGVWTIDKYDDYLYPEFAYFIASDYYLFGLITPKVFFSFHKKNIVKSAITISWNRINNKPYQVDREVSISNSKYRFSLVQYSFNYQRYYQITNFHSKKNHNGIYLNPTLTLNYFKYRDKEATFYSWGYIETFEKLMTIKKYSFGLQFSYIKSFRKNSQAIEFGFLLPVFDYANARLTGENIDYSLKLKKAFYLREPTIDDGYLIKLFFKFHIIWDKKSFLQ